MKSEKEHALEELRKIPGVNERAAEALWAIGIRSVRDLEGRDPIALYEELRGSKGSYAEPCMLNILKIAVQHATKRK